MSSASFFCLILVLFVSAADTSTPKTTTESSNPPQNSPDSKEERILQVHCTSVNFEGVCNECATGYILDTTSACISSILQHCARVEINDGTTCHTCSSGFLFDTTGACISSLLFNCKVVETSGTTCHTCEDTYKLSPLGTCIICPDNCASCSISNVCDQCDTSYFLYDNNGDTTCLSCAASCSSCTASPNCYMCADLVVQDGKTCRVDSIGYQLSFDEPFVIVDFAHSSERVYSISKIIAEKTDTTLVDPTNWKIGTRTDSQVKILTDNLHLSDLPVDIKLTFT